MAQRGLGDGVGSATRHAVLCLPGRLHNFNNLSNCDQWNFIKWIRRSSSSSSGSSVAALHRLPLSVLRLHLQPRHGHCHLHLCHQPLSLRVAVPLRSGFSAPLPPSLLRLPLPPGLHLVQRTAGTGAHCNQRLLAGK